MAVINGTAGNDLIHLLGDGLTLLPGYLDISGATSGDDVISSGGGGNDVISAGGGNDTLTFLGDFNAQDRVDGGVGNDTFTLNGNYSAGVTFGASTLVNVETIEVAAGNSYRLVTNDATVAANAVLEIDGSALLAGNTLSVDASAETNGRLKLIGGAGNDTLTAGTGDDFLYLYQGGNDTAQGGGGDDTFVFFGTFSAADRIDGGPGDDIVYLHGNYTAGVTFNAATMANVETIDLDDLFDIGDSFKLTTSDVTVAAGKTLTVNGSILGAPDRVVFDGSAETDGSFVLLGGRGNDVLTAGAGADKFTGGAGNDAISGGGGTDTAIFLGNRSQYTITFNATTNAFTIADQLSARDGTDIATSVEQLQFADALFAYDSAGRVISQTVVSLAGSTTRTLFDAAQAKTWATQVLVLDTQARLSSQTVNEDNGTRWVNTYDAASAANWTWTTDHYDAAGHLLSQVGLKDDGTHWLTLLDAAAQYSWSTVTLTYDAQWNQTGLSGTNDNGTHTVTMGAIMSALDTALWFATPFDPNFDPVPILLSGTAADYLVTFAAPAHRYLVSDQRPAAPDGGLSVDGTRLLQFGDKILPVASLATRFEGGDGDDSFAFGDAFAGADQVDGGGGANQMQVGGHYAGTIVLDPAKVLNIQVFAFAPGDDFSVQTLAGFAGAGKTFTFWSVSMSSANHVTIDAGAETTGGAFRFFLGQGHDSASGGSGNDLFYGEGGADLLAGGGGADTFAYLSAADSNGANGSIYDTITDFVAGTDKIRLAGTTVTAIDAPASGALSAASFDSDLASVLGNGHAQELDRGHAVLFTATAGDLGGQTFLVVGTSGAANGYLAGADYVIGLGGENVAGLAPADFV